MLKQTIQYINYDGVETTDTLWFNLTKSELFDNLHLRDRFQQIVKMLEGEPRSLSVVEVQSLLDAVKELMRLSYGERTEDGRRFMKGSDVWLAFTETATYDAFLTSLFEDPTRAVAFMVGIMPAEISKDIATDELLKSLDKTPGEASVGPFRGTTDGGLDASEARVAPVHRSDLGEENNRPLWMKEDRDPTPAEIREMGREEMVLAMQRRNSR